MKICLVLFSFSSLGFGQVNTGYPLVDAKMAAIPSASANSTDAIAIISMLISKLTKLELFFIGRHQISAMMYQECLT
jgi:hypothetical protein